MSTETQKLRFADCMSRLGTEGAFDVLVRARELEAQGKEVIHLEIGEPDFPTAPNIVDAAKRALDQGWTHYGPPAGIPELRQAVAEDVSLRRRISVDPAEVVITPGAKPIMFYAILALAGPGDEVLYPDPGFPIYSSMINFVGATPVPYATPEERGFDIDVNEIMGKISGRTRLLLRAGIRDYQVSTASMFGGPEWPSITWVSITASMFIFSQLAGAFASSESR